MIHSRCVVHHTALTPVLRALEGELACDRLRQHVIDTWGPRAAERGLYLLEGASGTHDTYVFWTPRDVLELVLQNGKRRMLWPEDADLIRGVAFEDGISDAEALAKMLEKDLL